MSCLKVEITIRDENYKRLDTFKCEGKDLNNILRTIRKKYGIPKIDWLTKIEV